MALLFRKVLLTPAVAFAVSGVGVAGSADVDSNVAKDGHTIKGEDLLDTQAGGTGTTKEVGGKWFGWLRKGKKDAPAVTTGPGDTEEDRVVGEASAAAPETTSGKDGVVGDATVAAVETTTDEDTAADKASAAAVKTTTGKDGVEGEASAAAVETTTGKDGVVGEATVASVETTTDKDTAADEASTAAVETTTDKDRVTVEHESGDWTGTVPELGNNKGRPTASTETGEKTDGEQEEKEEKNNELEPKAPAPKEPKEPKLKEEPKKKRNYQVRFWSMIFGSLAVVGCALGCTAIFGRRGTAGELQLEAPTEQLQLGMIVEATESKV